MSVVTPSAGRPRPALLVLLFVALVVALYASPLLVRRNFSGRDLIAYNLPMEKSIHDAYALGRLPVWTPEISGGRPLAPNPNAGALYPVRALLSPLPFPLAARIQPVLHWAAAGVGVLALLLCLDRSRAAAWIGAVTYVFSGVVVSEAFFPHIQPGMALLPWILWAVARPAAAPWHRLLPIGALFALDFLGADIFTCAIAIGSAALWIAIESDRATRLRGLGTLAVRGRPRRARRGAADRRDRPLDSADQPRGARDEALGRRLFLDPPAAAARARDPVPVRARLGDDARDPVGLAALPRPGHGDLRHALLRRVRRDRDRRVLEAPGARRAVRPRPAAGVARPLGAARPRADRLGRRHPSPLPLRNPRSWPWPWCSRSRSWRRSAWTPTGRARAVRRAGRWPSARCSRSRRSSPRRRPRRRRARRPRDRRQSRRRRRARAASLPLALAEAGLLWMASVVAIDLLGRPGRGAFAAAVLLLTAVPIEANRRIARSFREDAVFGQTAFARLMEKKDPAGEYRTLGEAFFLGTSPLSEAAADSTLLYSDSSRRAWTHNAPVLSGPEVSRTSTWATCPAPKACGGSRGSPPVSRTRRRSSAASRCAGGSGTRTSGRSPATAGSAATEMM
jgi:hypothetical protein